MPGALGERSDAVLRTAMAGHDVEGTVPGVVEGKVAIVTGAGRGIGRAIALLLAEEGARVVVNDVGAGLDGSGLDVGPAQQVVNEIKQKGGAAIGNTLSIGEPKNAGEIVKQTLDAF